LAHALSVINVLLIQVEKLERFIENKGSEDGSINLLEDK
jgi:hypothetical protein